MKQAIDPGGHAVTQADGENEMVYVKTEPKIQRYQNIGIAPYLNHDNSFDIWQHMYQFGRDVMTGATPLFFRWKGIMYQTVPGRPAVRLPDHHPAWQYVNGPDVGSAPRANSPPSTAEGWSGPDQKVDASLDTSNGPPYYQPPMNGDPQQQVKKVDIEDLQGFPIACSSPTCGHGPSDHAQSRILPSEQPGQITVSVPPIRGKRLSEHNDVNHASSQSTTKRQRLLQPPAEPCQDRNVVLDPRIVHPPQDLVGAIQRSSPCGASPRADIVHPTSTRLTHPEQMHQIESEGTREVVPREEISLATLIRRKNPVLPASFHAVFDSDQYHKILLLALHGIPCEAIAHVVQLDVGSIRQADKLSRITNIIAQYLPQIVRESDGKEDSETMVSNVFSRAESASWLPRILQQAADYIVTAAMDPRLARDERRKYARERKVLREWLDRVPNGEEGHRPSARGRPRKIDRARQDALSREDADQKCLEALGYRRDDPEAEKAIMLQWLAILRKTGQLPSLLEADRVVKEQQSD